MRNVLGIVRGIVTWSLACMLCMPTAAFAAIDEQVQPPVEAGQVDLDETIVDDGDALAAESLAAAKAPLQDEIDSPPLSDEQVEDDEGPEPKDAERSASDQLSFIYVSQNQIERGAIQEIALAFSDESIEFSMPRLYLKNEDGGVKAIEGGSVSAYAVLFSFDTGNS